MTLELYLIRHGESVDNTTGIIGGQSIGTPLTILGRAQAIALGDYLRREGIAFDRVYSSTAIRAIDTARLTLGDADIICTDRLLERSQGDWAGELRSERYTAGLRALMDEDPLNFKAPNGESQLETERRGTGFLSEEVDYTRLHGKVAIFGHGMLFKCMLHGILGNDPRMTWKIRIDNTSITKLSYDARGWHLECLNSTPHLRSTEGYYENRT